VGKLADAIYEGRHGQLEVEDDYEDYDGAMDDIGDEDSDEIDSSYSDNDEETEE
jgi:small subunit ribosomal protein S2